MRQTSPTAIISNTQLGKGDEKLLNELVYKNDVDGVKKCLQTNVMAWNTTNTSGMTPLMEASVLNRTAILDVLLSAKCDVNVTDSNGNTALHLAVDEGNTEVVKKLINSGRCIVDAMNDKGETALIKAAFYDYAEMVRTLLKDGMANPDIKDKCGQTALLVAMREGSHVAVDLLLKHGCDVTVTDNLGQSALYIAIHSHCNKSLDLAKRLISTGYDVKIDRMWLLNDEKHNLFYQDDEFYTLLRRRLRSKSRDTRILITSDLRTFASNTGSSTTGNVSPPFTISPSLKQKIMSPDSAKFPSIPFSQITAADKQDLEQESANPSRLAARRGDYKKAASFEMMSPRTPCLRPPIRSSVSMSDSDDSPMGSPVTRPRFIQQQISQLPIDSTHAQTKTKITNQTQKQLKYANSTVNKSNVDLSSPHSSTENELPTTLRDNEHKRSAPGSPVIQYKRQLSTQPPKPVPDFTSTQRKISLPCKPAVQFSSQIKVIEYSQRQ